MRKLDPQTDRLVSVTLDPNSIVSLNPDEEHERKVAIYDLLAQNLFAPETDAKGPFSLHIFFFENRLAFDVRHPSTGEPIAVHILSLTPLRGLIRDYFRVRDAYYEAIKSATPKSIEAVDMGRRGLHNDAAELLRERLKGKIAMDLHTARALFTLICVLQTPNGRIQRLQPDSFSVLFVCSMNAVRSPMAAALTRQKFGNRIEARSAGVQTGQIDGFVHEVMEEIGIDMSVHTPHSMAELAPRQYDLVIALSEEAGEAAQTRQLAKGNDQGNELLLWTVSDPTLIEGDRAMKLDAYRALRTELLTKITEQLETARAGGSQIS